MINNISSNNFSYTNYKNRENLSFSGKKFVQMKFLGEKYLVPKAVADVRRCVKQSFLKDPHTGIHTINVVNIMKDVFLGVAHLFDNLIDKTSPSAIGKKTNKGEYIGNEIYNHKTDKIKDLAIFQTKIGDGDIPISRSTQIIFSKKLPQKGELIYLISRHISFKGPKVIPCLYHGKLNPDLVKDAKGRTVAHFIYSDILHKKINPQGLSGSAVVNKNGELIGLQSVAEIYARDSKSTGVMSFIGLEDIKSFLKEQNITINHTDGNKPGDGFLSWLKRGLLCRK